MTDKDGLITYINPEFTKLYGYSENEILEKKTYKTLRSQDVSEKEHNDLIKKIFNRQVIKSKLLNKTKDGRLLTMMSYTNPIIDDKNNLIRFLVIQHKIEE